MRRVLGAACALLLAACVEGHVREADSLARSGDWEGALARYKALYEVHPDDISLVGRIDYATEKVIGIYTKRGDQSSREGKLGQAGEWWKKALDMCDPMVHPPERQAAWKDIDKNQTALEQFGDLAAAQKRHEEAAGVYGAILKVHPERVDLVQKNLDEQKAFAEELASKGDTLAGGGDLGAALVTQLRALAHDPMQPKAYQAGNALKKALHSRTRVNLAEIKVDDKGYHGLGATLAQRLGKKLDAFPPYGPTRDAQAVQARLRVTVVDFQKGDTKTQGTEDRPNEEEPPANGPPPPTSWQLAYTEVTRSVKATVRFEVIEPDFETPVVFEVTHQISRSDRTHSGNARHGVPPKALALPGFDQLTSSLAEQFDDGADVIGQARTRRVARLVDHGRASVAASQEAPALDAFVQVLFMVGPEGLPDDAAAFVARSMEREEFKEIVASN